MFQVIDLAAHSLTSQFHSIYLAPRQASSSKEPPKRHEPHVNGYRFCASLVNNCELIERVNPRKARMEALFQNSHQIMGETFGHQMQIKFNEMRKIFEPRQPLADILIFKDTLADRHTHKWDNSSRRPQFDGNHLIVQTIAYETERSYSSATWELQSSAETNVSPRWGLGVHWIRDGSAVYPSSCYWGTMTPQRALDSLFKLSYLVLNRMQTTEKSRIACYCVRSIGGDG